MSQDDARARIREIAARAAKRLEHLAGDPPPPLRHWSEIDRDREDAEEAAERQPGPAPVQLDMGDVRARETACARLRELLADGRWHSALELVEAGGLRYGGRLHEIRRGQDGAPALDVEAEGREHGGRRVWWYRAPRATPRSGPT